MEKHPFFWIKKIRKKSDEDVRSMQIRIKKTPIKFMMRTSRTGISVFPMVGSKINCDKELYGIDMPNEFRKIRIDRIEKKFLLLISTLIMRDYLNIKCKNVAMYIQAFLFRYQIKNTKGYN